MKARTRTLKELIEPDFINTINGIIINDDGIRIDIQNLHYKERNVVLDFVFAAMKDKWDRDFGKHERWLYVVVSETDHGIICPRCRFEYPFPEQLTWSNYQFCPHCGTKLDKPEEI
jgi:hypothetical protein